MRTRIIKKIKLATASKDFLWTNPEGRRLNAEAICMSLQSDRQNEAISSFEKGVMASINEWRRTR